ncbi:MAG: AzlD domain-containing protein [Clostridia bacterium]
MIYVYIAVMALITYLVRMLPLTLFQKKIKNKFVKSFLFYVPYVCLTAMTIPSIFSATRDPISAVVGFVVAVLVATKSNNLVLVAVFACLGVFVTEMILGMPI